MDNLQRESMEEQLKLIADIKIEKGDLEGQREHILQQIRDKEEEVQKRLQEMQDQTQTERDRVMMELEDEKA